MLSHASFECSLSDISSSLVFSYFVLFFFFFSSRRRHTRSLCDWSSDVCSSDLEWPLRFWLRHLGLPVLHAGLVAREGAGVLIAGPAGAGKSTVALACVDGGLRSEERRVGKEWRSRWSRCH